MSYLQENNKPVTLFELGKMRAEGRKIAMLTGYDASFAALLERCGVDVILVGDSLGNVLQGQKTTLPVSMEHMVYHTECVARGSSRPLIVADMPFGSYAESPEQAIRNAARLMAGEPLSTLAISAPTGLSRPKFWARSASRPWMDTPRRPRETLP